MAEVAFFSDRPGIRTLLLGALAQLCGDAGGPIDLALGLPVAAYANPEDRMGLISTFGGAAETVNGQVVRVGRVDVYPQGAGAFFAAAAKEPSLRAGLTGVVDVGY